MNKSSKELKAVVRENITGAAHVAIVVKDMEKSLKFYTELLGFEYRFECNNKGVPLVFLTQKNMEEELIQLPEDGTLLGVDSYYAREEDGQIQHICMYGNGNHLQDMIDALKELGVQVLADVPTQNPDVHEGSACFFFRGPDNEKIEIMY